MSDSSDWDKQNDICKTFTVDNCPAPDCVKKLAGSHEDTVWPDHCGNSAVHPHYGKQEHDQEINTNNK